MVFRLLGDRMKIIKTKLLQKCKEGKIGKYLVTLEINDNEIEIFENLAYYDVYDRGLLKTKYIRFSDKLFNQFRIKLWNKYDD